MKKLVLLLVFATSAAFAQQNGAPPQSGAARNAAPASQAKVLTNAEFDAFLAKPDQVLLIDVRRPDEITSNGGFPVFLNVQIGDLEKELAWIPRDRTIITVSNHASRGGRAADILSKAGFKVAGTIGAQTYEQAGGKLTKIVPPPAAANADANATKNLATGNTVAAK